MTHRAGWWSGFLGLREEEVGGLDSRALVGERPGDCVLFILFPISRFLWCHFLSLCHFSLSHPPCPGPHSRVFLGNHGGFSQNCQRNLASSSGNLFPNLGKDREVLVRIGVVTKTGIEKWEGGYVCTQPTSCVSAHP